MGPWIRISVTMQKTLILGGPGCGKTTYQLSQVDEALKSGTPSDRIAFVSFTKAAVGEARSRACDQFGFDDRDLPYFRTCHSLCFRELGLRRNEVMQPDDWKRISQASNVGLTLREKGDEMPGEGVTDGDRALSLVQYASAVNAPLRAVWQAYGEDTNWWIVNKLKDTIEEYKSKSGRIEFSDMLEKYSKQGSPVPVDVAIIDEAQDLTAAQWAVARRAFSGVDRILISGDDDQAIHTWAGAATNMFLSIKAPRKTLPISYRLPRPIWEQGNRISSRICNRFKKEWSHADHKGAVEIVSQLDDVSIDPKAGSWMILVRNNYMIREVIKHMRDWGLAYKTRSRSSIDPAHARSIICWERWRKGIATEDEALRAHEFSASNADRDTPWFDALAGISVESREYYRTLLRSGYKLNDEPQILISTIHGVKGMEADNVVLLTDVTRKIRNQMDVNADPEWRVFYVGATRARRNLYIVEPKDAAMGVYL